MSDPRDYYEPADTSDPGDGWDDWDSDDDEQERLERHHEWVEGLEHGAPGYSPEPHPWWDR